MRMRRSRERRREGLRCLRIELRATEIDALIRKRYVKTEARNERNALIQGLYEFLEEKLDDCRDAQRRQHRCCEESRRQRASRGRLTVQA
jgi:hypothetical protein